MADRSVRGPADPVSVRVAADRDLAALTRLRRQWAVERSDPAIEVVAAAGAAAGPAGSAGPGVRPRVRRVVARRTPAPDLLGNPPFFLYHGFRPAGEGMLVLLPEPAGDDAPVMPDTTRSER